MKYLLLISISVFCFLRPQAQVPEITSILVDACNGLPEGYNEYFTFQTNGTAVTVSDMSITFPAPLGTTGTYCSSCSPYTLGNNPTYLAQLNALAGCSPNLFVYATTIPAGATVIVFTGNPPTYTMNFSYPCGTPIYVIFCNNTSDPSGRFANYGTTGILLKTLTVNFGSSTDAVTYDKSQLSHHDGDIAYFTNDAAGTVSYASNGCVTTLSVIWKDFNVYSDKYDARIEWTTASEKDNDYFAVERRSPDGEEFNEIARIRAKGDGNSDVAQSYSTTDLDLASGLYYYRIKQVDLDGEASYSDTRSVVIKEDEKIELFKISNEQLIFNNYFENTSVSVVDISGRTLYETQVTSETNKIDWTPTSSGIYLIRFIDKTGNSQVVKFKN